MRPLYFAEEVSSTKHDQNSNSQYESPYPQMARIFVLNLRHLQNLRMNQTRIESCWNQNARKETC